jgi:hypothetical protein
MKVEIKMAQRGDLQATIGCRVAFPGSSAPQEISPKFQPVNPSLGSQAKEGFFYGRTGWLY